MHPELGTTGTFDHLRLGRLAPVPDDRTLQLARYLDDAKLPPIPDTVDYTTVVPAWPMYENDRLGDCTIAAAAHMIQGWTGHIGKPCVPSGDDVDKMYWLTGKPAADTGEAGGPTDTGRYELEVLNYWRNTGLGDDRIAAYAAIDPTNHDHVRAAIYLFGGIYTGVALPETAQGQTIWDVVGDGRTGTSKPGSWGGHAVPFLAYDDAGVTLVTWGAPLKATWAFHDAYVDEAYAIISPDFFSGDKTIEGFDQAALLMDLHAITAA